MPRQRALTVIELPAVTQRGSTPVELLAVKQRDSTPVELLAVRQRGFTLIELLVVIAIIVALLAILMPSLSEAVTTAHRAVCMSNTRQQHQAQLNYLTDHRGAFMSRNAHSPDYHRWGGNVNSPVTLMRGTYMPQLDILICPLVADVPGQSGGVYQRNDWLSGAYGGWDTDASNVYTAYMWFGGFSAVTPVYLNETAPLPRHARDLGSRVPFITHRLNFYTPSNSHEISHGGRGLAVSGVVGVAPYDDYQTTDMPLTGGDGSTVLRTRGEILPRLQLPSGGTGTYLW